MQELSISYAQPTFYPEPVLGSYNQLLLSVHTKDTGEQYISLESGGYAVSSIQDILDILNDFQSRLSGSKLT